MIAKSKKLPDIRKSREREKKKRSTRESRVYISNTERSRGTCICICRSAIYLVENSPFKFIPTRGVCLDTYCAYQINVIYTCVYIYMYTRAKAYDKFFDSSESFYIPNCSCTCAKEKGEKKKKREDDFLVL